MATKTYLLTIEETELTDELRALLERKGAYLQEEPIEELHLPEQEAQAIARRMDEAENGRSFKSWKQVREEVRAYRASQRKHD